jgi:hypothetical protein
MAGSVAAGALLVVDLIGYYGWFVVLFLFTLRPEVGAERNARLHLERWQREHGQGGPGDAPAHAAPWRV